MAATLGTIEGNLIQAELLEARTGIQIKDMQGVNAWKDPESGKFGIEIVEQRKAGLLNRTKTATHRLAMSPRPDGKPVTFADAQRIAKHMDSFLRDRDYQAPKAKKEKAPKQKQAAKAKPENDPTPKRKPGDLPSFMQPGAKTMDERVAEHQAKKAAEQAKPTSRWAWLNKLHPKNWGNKATAAETTENSTRKEPRFKPEETASADANAQKTDAAPNTQKTHEPAEQQPEQPTQTSQPTPDEALATISDFPKEMAEKLGVTIPEENTNAWKDLTGAGHLYIRGAAAPLMRMAADAHDADAAGAAMGTVGFANKKPQVFPGEHVSEVAAIAAKLLDAEKAGAKLSDTLNADELDLISREINNFSKQLETLATVDNAPDYLKKYAQNVSAVNADFQSRAQNDIKPTLTADTDGQTNDAAEKAASEKPATPPVEGDAAKAVAILSDFPKEMAETMGVEIPADAKDNWRDITGSGHVYVRGAWASLERIANNTHDADAANAAMGTIGYAQKAPEKFIGENAADVAKIAAKILQVEKDGGSVSDAVTAQDVEILKTELNRFTEIVASQGDNAPAFLKKYAEQASIANNHYQDMATEIVATLKNGSKAAPKPAPSAANDDSQPAAQATTPARETKLMKAANAALLKQKNIDIDDVLDADPSKVFEKIDSLDLKADGTKFESVETLKQALKDLKAHRVAVRAKHAFSTDNVVAMAAREKENALTDKKLSTLNMKIDTLDPDAIENIDVPLPKNGKDRVIKVTYKDPETTGPKRITIPYSRGAKASIDTALSKLRAKFGEVDGHEHICHATQDFVRNNAREHGAVQDEYKIDINKTDDLGLIHFGDVLYSQIGRIAGMNKEDVLGVNASEDGSLEFVNFNGETKTVNANVNKSIFRSAEDMAEALNRSLEHARYMKAAAVQHTPSAEAA